MSDTALLCRQNHRRDKLRSVNLPTHRWNGIDDVEFEPKPQPGSLRVYFLCEVPAGIEQRPDEFEIFHEQTREKFEVIKVTKHTADSVLLTTKPPLCPNSSYTLTLLRPNDVDPRFARRIFITTPEKTDVDPRPPAACPPRAFNEPRPNYLARDYASFRQLLLDRLALLAPEWTERHIPDLGVTLVEMFAYVGDYLAYYQDAVATEAYLNTARQRISVQRHARLVDYQLHEGCNARTFVHLQVTGNFTLDPEDAFFITEHPDNRLKNRAVLSTDDLKNLPPHSYEPFEVILGQRRCPRLECDDVKNLVGLIGWLVSRSHDDELAGVLWELLPSELQRNLLDYASVANSAPVDHLTNSLIAQLNVLLHQHPLWVKVDFSKLMSTDCWQRCSMGLPQAGVEARHNLAQLKECLADFISRPESRLIELRADHNNLYFYTWNQSECFLPVGATSATLLDHAPEDESGEPPSVAVQRCSPTPLDYDDPSGTVLPTQCDPASPPTGAKASKPPRCSPFVLAHLQRWRLRNLSCGDVLIFEEVLGAKTHNAADANPAHRQAVRLTRVQFCLDPVTKVRLVEIEWAQEDALKFPLCISSIGPAELGCVLNERISVAHGNVLLVDHGRMIDEPEWLGEVRPPHDVPTCDQTFCHEPLLPEPSRSELFRPVLKESDLTYAETVDLCAPASKIFEQQPDEALPQLDVFGFPAADEPPDAVRDAQVPPPQLVTFDDYDNPQLLLDRLHTFSDDEVRRLEAILPPQAARFLQEVRNDPRQWKERRTLLPVSSSGRECLPAEPAAGDASSLSRRNEADFRWQFKNFSSGLQGALIWKSQKHLLDSDRDDQHFVVEMNNERRARLRFGDDDLGRRPLPQTSYYARYRRGNGVPGNVGADKIKHLVFRRLQVGAVESVRNPLPAQGGMDPESLDHARLHAPHQFKKQRRAITTDDYAAIVRRDFGNKVQNARATLNWMGTWYEVAVAIDPRAEIRNTQQLVEEIKLYLEQYRRIGHLLRVELPTYVPLHIEMTVCVKDGYLRAHIQRELLDRFGSGRNADGSPGFFHPDNFTFGDALYLSRLIHEAKKIHGVENISVTRFERRGQGPQGELDNGVMSFGPLEIPRLDNDPRHPENGCFCLDMRGAR